MAFTASKAVVTPINFINLKSDFVKIIYGNGYGCFNEMGKMTRIL